MVDLKAWLIGGPSSVGFSDLHIDAFDPIWRERSRWLEGAVSVLEAAVRLNSAIEGSCRLALLFALKETPQVEPLGLLTRSEFEDQLDMHTPPSIYMADSLSEPWINSRAYDDVLMDQISEAIATQIFAAPLPCDGLFMQYGSEGNGITRSVWLIPRTELGR